MRDRSLRAGRSSFAMQGRQPRARWRPQRLFAPSLLLLVLVLTTCGGVDTDSGATAWLRVAGGQFVAGDLERVGSAAPEAAEPGPAVISIFNSVTAVQPGERDKPVDGALGPTATAAALGLRGDRGYWIVVAGPPLLDTPDLPAFQATLSFAADLPVGSLALVVRAVDGAGRFGPPAALPLVGAPTGTPTGALVVRLRWEAEADLDLHVITPDGIEIWAGNINSYRAPPPGTTTDGSDWEQGGILDFDSNAGCVIDGRRMEAVVWQTGPPPSGRYQVRVDAASLCGAAAASWTVDALLGGAVIAASQGLSLPSDVRFSKGPGSGLQALAFDVLAP